MRAHCEAMAPAVLSAGVERRSCLARSVAFDARPRTLQRFPKATPVEWFEEIIESLHLECPQGVFIVRRSENYQRPCIGDGTRHFEAIHLRHLYIQEHNIGTRLLQRGEGIDSVFAFACNFAIGLKREQASNAAAGESFVIHD